MQLWMSTNITYKNPQSLFCNKLSALKRLFFAFVMMESAKFTLNLTNKMKKYFLSKFCSIVAFELRHHDHIQPKYVGRT